MSAPPPLPAGKPALWPKRLLFCVPALLLYIIACALPALRLANGDSWPGIQLLGFGWLGIFDGQLGWYANFFWIGALVAVLRGQRLMAAGLVAAGIAIGLDTLGLTGQEIILDEGGVNKTHVASLGPGAYLWLAALAASLLGLFGPPRPRSAP